MSQEIVTIIGTGVALAGIITTLGIFLIAGQRSLYTRLDHVEKEVAFIKGQFSVLIDFLKATAKA